MTPSPSTHALADHPDPSANRDRESSYTDSARLPDGAAPFANRHNGPRGDNLEAMLEAVGVASLDELTNQTIPEAIRLDKPLQLDPPHSEHQALARLHDMVSRNRVARSMIGMGYYDTHTPPVLHRNILENPLWYTPYTPYQAEIAQGRLEALLNFQTMVTDLTAMDIANASMLDEATAAAEAMAMCFGIARQKKKVFYVADDAHPQTIHVMKTRAWSMGIELRVGSPRMESVGFESGDVCGILLQYPTTDGRIENYDELTQHAHEAGALVVVASDLLALTLLRPPGELRRTAKTAARISSWATRSASACPWVIGGPHAAFMATRDKHAAQDARPTGRRVQR